MIPALVRQLEERHLGARRLALHGFRVDGSVAAASVATAIPSRDPKHLARLLADKAAMLDPEFGFDAFALVADWTEDLGAAQESLVEEPSGERELARLIDRLAVKLGPRAVRRPQPQESHLPERASGWVSALAKPKRIELPPVKPASTPPRPARSHRRRLCDPGGVPRRFMWRRAVHDIARVEGPERIAPEWWRQPSTTRLRDYYRVEDASRPPLLDLSRRRDRRRARRRAQLVHPRAFRLMPEKTGFSRLKLVRTSDMPPPPTTPSPYVELGVSSPFSFLRGASDAIELVLTALPLGYDAIGIADRNTLAGVVRMHSACTNAGIRPLIGCRLDLTDAPSLLAYPIDRDGYGRLSRLLSLGKMRAEKGDCELSLSDVAAHQKGIAFIAWPSDDLSVFAQQLPRLRDALTSLRHVAASWLYRGDDSARIERLDRLARKHGCTILATNDVHYHAPDRRPLQDVVTCIREKVTIATAGYLLNPNAERHLKSPEEMARLFARWPHAIAATREFADSLHFGLDELRYEYPKETVPEGRTPQEHLDHLTWDGARKFWPEGIPDKVAEAAQL